MLHTHERKVGGVQNVIRKNPFRLRKPGNEISSRPFVAASVKVPVRHCPALPWIADLSKFTNMGVLSLSCIVTSATTKGWATG